MDYWSEGIWIEQKKHYTRPLNMVIDVLVAYSLRNRGWMVKVYNRLEPYKAGPFATREEAFGIGKYYIKTRIQILDYLLSKSPNQGPEASGQNYSVGNSVS